MNSRKTSRIGNIGKVVTGKTPSTAMPDYFGADYPFLTPTDMRGNKWARATERGLSTAGAATLRSRIPAGSVAVSCIGWQMGKAVLTDRPTYTNQQINTIIPNSGFDAEYLYYYFATRREELLSIGAAGGVRTPIINKSSFEAMEVELPALRCQRSIASILCAYDDLIENNTRRIAILEEMARRLYEEWFVRFRFPGHEGVRMVESELGLVPEGWDFAAVQDVMETHGGGTPSKTEPNYWTDGQVNWYSPTDLTRAKTVFAGASSSKITDLGLSKSSAKLFPPMSVMMTSRATLGVIAVNTTAASTNQGFITCIPSERFPLWLLYHWLKENAGIFENLATGATFKEITKGVFRKIELLVPPLEMSKAFELSVGPMMSLVLQLELKNANLRTTRDLLLPKLISGELDVSTLAEPQGHTT